ncbi:MAG TPA: hypothetical protein ENK02_10620 [Planctomycetes bacterium]|nr:hypothetical protein [Planctomycetota bacterium]
MKAIFFLLLAVVFVGGGIYLVDSMGEASFDSPKVTEPDLEPKDEAPAAKKTMEKEKPPSLTAPKKVSSSKKQKIFTTDELYGVATKRLWAKLRPPEEALVPDPDHVGPCPPASDGGHPALVIRRYKEQDTGYFVWIHEDGAKTVISPDPVDLGASRTSPGAHGYTITTMVPTQATRLAPDDDKKN